MKTDVSDQKEVNIKNYLGKKLINRKNTRKDVPDY